MQPILLTGYEPFGEFETNPARRLATTLDGEEVSGTPIVGRELPVSFDRALPALRERIDEHDPALVVSVGLAGGRNALSIERIGINLRETGETPDNDGREVVDEPVASEGPDAYFSTLPVREMQSAMCEAGVPTTLSTAAGTHLCNDILYATRHLAETEDRGFRSGFVHVPFSHEGAAARGEGEPSMSLETMARGLRVGLETALETA
ncbi:pyroglutamyl-peptidase I [Natrononativus amylolyticus]|uniref:pyroglutamyl-peptidase I n=1 Tax=Natrononativus amylolyticus TaxID=2963434 RepID=UPI0020CBA0A8|nr:pyroglutamyl-peptidase I [Natrononativus amylolyticus]